MGIGHRSVPPASGTDLFFLFGSRLFGIRTKRRGDWFPSTKSDTRHSASSLCHTTNRESCQANPAPVGALRIFHPNEVVYTFWDYMRGAFTRNAGLRIDHLLLSSELAPRLVAAGVVKDVRALDRTSGHASTWIELAEEG